MTKHHCPSCNTKYSNRTLVEICCGRLHCPACDAKVRYFLTDNGTIFGENFSGLLLITIIFAFKDQTLILASSLIILSLILIYIEINYSKLEIVTEPEILVAKSVNLAMYLKQLQFFPMRISPFIILTYLFIINPESLNKIEIFELTILGIYINCIVWWYLKSGRLNPVKLKTTKQTTSSPDESN